MEEGTSGSRKTRSQVAPDWTVKDCLILVNEVAAVEADYSNAFSSFQKWTMISENCNAFGAHRTLNQCRRKWDSLVSDYNQIKQWESEDRGNGHSHSYWYLSTEKRKQLNLPVNIDNELFEAINAVLMIQEDKAGAEPDSDPEAQDGSDILDFTAELLGSKRSRQGTMVVEKENLPRKTKKEEEPERNRVLENTREQDAKTTQQNKSLGEKKTLEEISTDEEEKETEETRNNVEEDTVDIQEDKEAMEAKLGEKADLIHAIVERNLAKDIGIDDKMKFVRLQGDELIDCLTEIVSTLNKLKEVSQELE